MTPRIDFREDFIYLLPTIAIGIGEHFWVEIAWLGVAIGFHGSEE
jgi:hypothetical protein